MAGKVISRFQSGSGIHLISSTFYGICDTAASEQVKKVEINDEHVTELKLIPGMLLSVKFTNGNTAANPKLKIYAKGTVPPNENSPDNPLKDAVLITPNILTWGAGEVILFVYNNEQWISNYLSVSGGNLIGNIHTTANILADGNITASGSISASDFNKFRGCINLISTDNIDTLYKTGFYYIGSNGVQGTMPSNDLTSYFSLISMGSTSETSTGWVGKQIAISYNKIFVRSYSDSPRKWSQWIEIDSTNNYLPLSGGTLTGHTTINNHSFYLKSTDLTNNTAPTATNYGDSYLYFTDSNNRGLGFINPSFDKSGNQYLRFYASRPESLTTSTGTITAAYNGFSLGITNSGSPIVGFSNQSAWQTALGIGAIGLKNTLSSADLPTVPITKGGTGATTTANAQKALMGTADTDWAYLKGSANVTQYSRWRCKSGIVFVELYYTANAGLSTANKNFGTIPTGYRPNKEVDVAAYLGQNVLHFATMWVDTGGNVIAKTADGTSNSIYCSLSYPL